MTNPILEGYKGILVGNIDDRTKKALDYVAACLNPDTPSHTVSIHGLLSKTLVIFRQIDPKNREKFDELENQVEAVLRERGYRVDIYTCQEHKIMGSTVFREYAEQPYKPIGIIKGELTIEEANNARQLAKRQSAFGKYFGVSDDYVKVSLEPLDGNGNTIQDPRVLDERLEPVPTKYSTDFPFRRI